MASKGTHVKVLSIRQPWAHAIMRLGKDVENRSWPTHYRGPLLIHAGKTPDRSAFPVLNVDRRAIEYGAIVGIVDLVDCRQDAEATSSWAVAGMWHWVLDAPREFEPIPCPGQLRLFDAPELIRKRVERLLTR